MLRKFILVAAMALFEPGSTVQLMVAQLICFGYVLTVVIFKPYKKNEADFTNAASGAVASPLYVCGAPVLRAARCRLPRRPVRVSSFVHGWRSPLWSGG